MTAVFLAAGVWFITTQTSLSEVGKALAQADGRPILLGLVIMLATLLLKAWRWQILLAPQGPRPAFAASFSAIMLGQYVNLLIPFLRLGEIARIYALKRQIGWSRGKALGTLVVEKAVDLIMLILTLALLIPLVALPEYVSHPQATLGATAVLSLLTLYLLAFQTRRIITLSQTFARLLPQRLARFFLRLVVSGLEGLSALRHTRALLLLLAQSFLIAGLSVLLPLTLFSAFHLPLGVKEAILLNAAGTLVQIPPSTPLKIGILDGMIAGLLISFGVTDEAAVVNYTVVLHLTIVLPQILLGSVAANRTGWRWRDTALVQAQDPGLTA